MDEQNPNGDNSRTPEVVECWEIISLVPADRRTNVGLLLRAERESNGHRIRYIQNRRKNTILNAYYLCLLSNKLALVINLVLESVDIL